LVNRAEFLMSVLFLAQFVHLMSHKPIIGEEGS